MSEQKKYANGDLSGMFTGTVAAEPKVRELTSKDGKSNYELVDIRVVCNPYNGQKDPEAIWMTIRVSGAQTAIAKTLNKGDTIVARGQIRPRTWETNDGETRHELDFILSRDWSSLQRVRFSNNGNSGSSAPAPAAAVASNDGAIGDDDIPF